MPSAKAVIEQFYDDERIYMSSPPDKQDPDLLANTLASNIRLYQSEDLPYGGTWEGVEGFLAWGKIMGGLFSKVDVKPTKILEDGDDVVVISNVHFQVRRTGKDIVSPFIQHIKVDTKAGKITEFRPFYWNVKGLVEALNEA